MGLKLKGINFLELTPTFVEVTGGKLVGGSFASLPHPLSLIGFMAGNEEHATANIQRRIF